MRGRGEIAHASRYRLGTRRRGDEGAVRLTVVIKLGRISYVNMAPVFHRLEYDVEEIVGVPTELNRMLIDGQLDIAPISSIEYARHADSLRLLPRLCVSSEGAVDSIQLVTRLPLGRVRSVAVTPESATSVVLTGAAPGAEIRPFDEEADAKLLIGDAALKSAFEDPTPHYDLGRLWLEKTGLPMVFAVWAAQEPLVEGITDLEHALVARSASRAPSPRSSPTRRASATATRPASWRATSRSSATASALASAPASTRSSRWPATSASCTTCPSSALHGTSESSSDRAVLSSGFDLESVCTKFVRIGSSRLGLGYARSRPMGRRLLATVLVRAARSPPPRRRSRERSGPASPTTRAVQFTPHGPVALNVLIGPRPGGTTTLAPALSNETLTGTETLTAMQRRLRRNGHDGRRQRRLLRVRDGRAERRADARRAGRRARRTASARAPGCTTDGTLDMRRISFFGTWQGAGAKRTLNALNEPPPANGIALYTQAWGADDARRCRARPPRSSSRSRPRCRTPTSPRPSSRCATAAAPVPIPLGGAVLVAVGAAAAALAAEAPVGQHVTSRLDLQAGLARYRLGDRRRPADRSQRRPGVPRRRGVHDEPARRRGLRAPGSASSPTAASSSSPSTAASPGTRSGMTNFELAQTLVRLGAVTGMALDGGGSTTMAFDGTLLNRPSGASSGRSRRRSLFQYTGVFVQPAVSVVSPDGDGVADRQSLRYKLVRPSTVTVTLTAPDGSVAYTETSERQAGSYGLAFPPPPSPPPVVPPPVEPPRSTASCRPSADDVARTPGRHPAGERALEARRLAVDDIGQASEMEQAFTVNTTLGYLGHDAPQAVPAAAPAATSRSRGSRAGRRVSSSPSRRGRARWCGRSPGARYPAGSRALVWNGLDRQRKAVKGGTYVVRVVARNALGTIELTP